MNQGQQALTKEQIFAINEAQKIRDIANLLEDKGLPFKLVDSKLFRRLTGKRRMSKDYLVIYAVLLEVTYDRVWLLILINGYVMQKFMITVNQMNYMLTKKTLD
ncbi:Hypothetical_protein [Hexamita inflata]|uniref:Hypothetical_protein n=1 Tax=Hexamita inflata TaxID=28002 RepID=A0AA86NVC0_9EUKA|nr:Hypothetical protein HINF_LOCUS13400 [Hexamita inflata]